MSPQPINSGFVPTSSIDKLSGKCRYYDIPTGRWREAWPVDVREMIHQGTANFTGPEVKLVGPEGEITVHANQVQAKLENGYTYAEKGKEKLETTPETTQEETGEEGGVYDFTKHSVSELKEFAERAGINGKRLSKPQLIEALDEANFDPNADEDEEDESDEDEDEEEDEEDEDEEDDD